MEKYFLNEVKLSTRYIMVNFHKKGVEYRLTKEIGPLQQNDNGKCVMTPLTIVTSAKGKT